MKKIFICALLLCLCLPFDVLASSGNEKPFISETEAYIQEGPNAVFCPEKRGALVRAVKPGSEVIFPIENAKKAEDLKDMKIFAVRWEMGQEFTTRPYIEYRMLYEEDGETQKGYSYVAVLPVLSLAGADQANVRGSLTLGKHLTGNLKRKFSFVIRDDGTNPYSDPYVCTGKDFSIEFDSAVHQVTLIFDDKAEFMVDASGQGQVNVGFSTESYSDIEARYGKYDVEYLSFLYNPVFDKEGELNIRGSEGKYIYEITPDGLKLLDTEYDREKSMYILKTRRLGNYVISDRKLSDRWGRAVVYNPPTGAEEA